MSNWTTVCTTCLRLFMTSRRTAVMALSTRVKNATAATRMSRSNDFFGYFLFKKVHAAIYSVTS